MQNSLEILQDEKTEEIKQIRHIVEVVESNKPVIGKIQEALHYQQDNEFIHHGYRINFTKSRNILKSLFMLHNEFVNVWLHLLGVAFVTFLFIYTAIYINQHKGEIYDVIDTKFENFNPDWSFSLNNLQNFQADMKAKYEDSKHVFNEYAGLIKNKTNDYIDTIDVKLGEYKQYFKEKIHCVECLRGLSVKLLQMKHSIENNYEEFSNMMKTLLDKNVNITNIEFDLGKYIEEINSKLHDFKEEIMEKIDSENMEWVDIYAKENPKLRRFPLFIFLFTAIVCLSCSSIFHLFHVHSLWLSRLLGKLDYAGISLLIAGSCFPPYYYLFLCSPKLMYFYLSFVSIFAIAVFLFTFQPDFATSAKRNLRGFLFLTLGLSAALPMIHIVFFSSYITGMIHNLTLINWVLGGVCYVVGCLIYVNRIPECKWPGKFCIWGSSHQIWHLMVVGGIVFHFFGSLDSYYDRINNTC